jgi:hypothetical protein
LRNALALPALDPLRPDGCELRRPLFRARRPAHARVARVLTKTSVRASSRVAAGRFRADLTGADLRADS